MSCFIVSSDAADSIVIVFAYSVATIAGQMDWYSNLPGQGFIETIGNYSSNDILRLALGYVSGGSGNDSHVLNAATASGAVLNDIGDGAALTDLGGIDTLRFTDASPALTVLRPGVMGFYRSKYSADLLIDLNQNGEVDYINDGKKIVFQDFRLLGSEYA